LVGLSKDGLIHFYKTKREVKAVIDSYIVVGQKRVSVATLRKILGLEDVKDNSGRVVQDAPLELWAKSGQLIKEAA
jgi:chromosome segregation and condensation protein ScpB